MRPNIKKFTASSIFIANDLWYTCQVSFTRLLQIRIYNMLTDDVVINCGAY